jgi:Zn-dependent peptidase ImmA (M78 family)
MTSVVAELRALVPVRPLTASEAMRVAELQATRLLKLAGVEEPPLPEGVIATLPRVRVERSSPIPVSGSAQWAKGVWHVVLNGAEPLVRQRFSLAHETKHILDAPFVSFLYPEIRGVSSRERGERVADYFAGCLLMPKLWINRAWTSGAQRLPGLARRFGVSEAAMQVRLLQMGLIDPLPRCGPIPNKPTAYRSRRYFRTAPAIACTTGSRKESA